MSKKEHRKPAAFRVEDVEIFTPPAAPEPGEAAASPLPVAKARAVPDLRRGLRWGSILFGALGVERAPRLAAAACGFGPQDA